MALIGLETGKSEGLSIEEHLKPLDGIVDYLSSVIFSPNILSRGSLGHTLLKLLAKAEVLYDFPL